MRRPMCASMGPSPHARSAPPDCCQGELRCPGGGRDRPRLPGAAALDRSLHRCWASRLGHTPEERQRTLDDAADIAAPSLIAVVEAGRHVDDMLHGCLVEACDGRIL